jgi:CubicO group peptidase (beta-lactamase class C family)
LSLLVVFLLASTSGCGGGGAVHDGGNDTRPDGGPAPDAPGEAAASSWSHVEDALARAAEAAGPGAAFGLTVWDNADRRVFERMVGGFTPDRRVAIASASKMISGLVIFESVRRGELSLEATTGEVLGWTGANASITMRHLLSFTSGLGREALCTVNPLVTLATCVERIRDAPVVAPPGTRFDYGSTHLHVAARMAEVAAGKTWAQLFDEALRVPLGLPPEVAYFTAPKQATGVINPLIAGGLRASMNEYAPMLALVYHHGAFGGRIVGTRALFQEQTREPFPDVVIGQSPVADIGLSARYGLTAWLMCDTPAAGCASISSPGAFGFTPWLDREAGYYAILGMELPRDTADSGVVDFAVKLQQELAPLVAAQVR